MTKEYLEAFERIMKIYGNTNSLEGTYNYFLIIKKALQRLEAIDNANPSEALKLAELLECDLQATNDLVTRTINGYDYLDILETIKQALLKAQEPKHYLKWEDLEFRKKGKGMKVLLNGKEYTLFYGLDVDTTWVELVSIENYRIVFTLNDECKHYKQFFNDLHLERVEE